MYRQTMEKLNMKPICGLIFAVFLVATVTPRDALANQEEYCETLRLRITIGFVDLRSLSEKDEVATELSAFLQLHEISDCPKARLNKVLICVDERARKMLKEQGAVDNTPLFKVAKQCLE